MNTYLKIAFRLIARHKVYACINILGLTIGLSAALLLATVVIDDLSYDRAWKNSQHLYRILTVNKMSEGMYYRFNAALVGMTGRLKADYPEVRAVASMYGYKVRFKLDNRYPNGVEVAALRADTSIWQMLDLALIAGASRNYVSGIGNLVVTATFAREYFPHTNPIGKTVYSVPTYSNKPEPFLITGIVKDLPSNSVFRAQVITLEAPWKEALTPNQSGSFSMDNYALVRPGTDTRALADKFNRWYTGFTTSKTPFLFEFQPLRDVYLHSDFAGNQQVKADSRSIYIFSAIALLVLLIACVNYINLTTARAVQRLPETGVRKVLGAERKQLVSQFLIESALFFLISAALATLIYALSLPLVERFLRHPLAMTLTSRCSLFVSAYLATILISLLAGSYPAWLLSGFKPAATLRGKFSFRWLGGQQVVRKSLVTLQFSISITVLIALLVIRQQVSYMKGKDLGFNKNNLMEIGSIVWNGKGAAFKNELLRSSDIVSASITSWTSPGSITYSKEIDDPGHPGNKVNVDYLGGDIDLAKTLGLGLVKGRMLDRPFAADVVDLDSIMRMDARTSEAAESRESSLITAYTARTLGVTALNAPIKGALTTPVGVVKDFYNESLKKPLTPLIIIAERAPDFGGMLVRVAPGSEAEVAEFISKKWREFFPDKLFEIRPVAEIVNDMYKSETAMQQIFAFFSGLSMFLAGLGILGLIIHATGQRRKEIGVRKVLGASIVSLVRLFSVDFLKLIMVSLLIASPIAWWLMSRWLADYAYRISIHPWTFVAAGVATAMIALAAIGGQTVRAAWENPANSLRNE